MGIGGAASIVGRRVMYKYGKETLAIVLRNSIEAFGIPFATKKRKAYLFGVLPIADAFIAWSNAVDNRRDTTEKENGRASFQQFSLLLFTGSLLLLAMLWKGKSLFTK